MGVLVTPYQEEQGHRGCAPEEQGPQGLRQDPLGLGVESRGIPLGKEEATRPLSMVPES